MNKQPEVSVENFHIIQALCRAALAKPSDSVRQQVVRLRDALQEAGDVKNAKSLTNLLTAAERSVEMAPSKFSRSKAAFKGEELTRNTHLPVSKETSVPIAEIKFVEDLPTAPPIFGKAVMQAIEAILEEWKHLEKIA